MGWKVDYNTKVGEIICKGQKREMFDSNGLIAADEIRGYDAVGNLMKMVFCRLINEDHLRNILGLTPGYENLLEGQWEKITLYKNKCKNWELIANTFKESGMDIEIEIIDG